MSLRTSANHSSERNSRAKGCLLSFSLRRRCITRRFRSPLDTCSSRVARSVPGRRARPPIGNRRSCGRTSRTRSGPPDARAALRDRSGSRRRTRCGCPAFARCRTPARRRRTRPGSRFTAPIRQSACSPVSRVCGAPMSSPNVSGIFAIRPVTWTGGSKRSVSSTAPARGTGRRAACGTRPGGG